MVDKEKLVFGYWNVRFRRIECSVLKGGAGVNYA